MIRTGSGIVVGACLVGATLLFSGCSKDAGPEPGKVDTTKAAKSEHSRGHEGSTHEGMHGPGHVATSSTEITQKTCPVMGNPIDPKVFVDYKGRRVYFCCKPCISKFQADPDKYLAKLDSK